MNEKTMIADLSDSSVCEVSTFEAVPPCAERIFQAVLGRIAQEPARVRTDANGHVVDINPAFSGLCGYTFEEIRGRKPGSLLQGSETTEDSILALRNAIRSRESCSVEMVNYHKNQTTYRVQIDLSPRFNSFGELEGFEALERKLS
ncbi:MAG: PAS domain-containing protein [Spartobacteria bacterium]